MIVRSVYTGAPECLMSLFVRAAKS